MVFFSGRVLKESNLCQSIKSGSRIRIITNITKKDIPHCEKLLSKGLAINHVPELDGENMILNDRFLLSFTIHRRNSIDIRISNVKEVMDPHFLRLQQILFNKLWADSIPAKFRVNELKEEKKFNPIIQLPKTEVIENPIEIEKRLSDFIRNSTTICTCTSIGGIQMIQKYFLNLHKETMKNYLAGKYKGTKWITTVNDEMEVQTLKKILNDSMEIRHIPNVSALTNFAFNDDFFVSSIDRMKDGNLMTSLIISNDPLYLNHYRSIFEEMWKSSQRIEDRFMDIKENISDSISLLYNPEEAVAFARKVFESAKQEILIILSSTNAALRLDQNKEFAMLNENSKKGIKVKVIIPLKKAMDNEIREIVSKYPFIEFRFLPFTTFFLIGTAIIDRQKIISFEVKNDTKKSYFGAIRLCLFIESKSTALSFGTLFENLWKQTELYKQLQSIERLQNDFINIASHELRTPIQSIMGFAEILRRDQDLSNHKEHIDAIRRNAIRIKELSNRLIEVTQIDNKLLKLKSETFDFKALILEVIKEQNRRRIDKFRSPSIDLKCIYRSDSKWHYLTNSPNQIPILITGDRIRLSQVLTNLIDNAYQAISLAKDGQSRTVIIKIEKVIHLASTTTTPKRWLVISVVDSGIGIHPDLVPRLFAKFTTNSSNGLGLGLYFSKEIVRDHGGKIWAKNNKNGKGSTVSFKLPL